MFGDRLRIIRIYRGYKLQQIADELGIPIHSYQNYEGNRRIPDHSLLINIADLLDVPLDFLLERDDYLQKLGVQVDVPLDVPPRRGKKQ